MSLRLLAIVASLIAAGLGLIAHIWSRNRDPNRDCGTFWARVIQWFCILPVLLLLSSWFENLLPTYWQTGRHLQLDLTIDGPFGWPPATRFIVALLLPLAYWLLLLVIGIVRGPGERETGRWIAGAVGYGNRRSWVLLCALPLLPVLILTYSRLGGGPGGYSAATWMTLAVLVLSLIGVAASAGRPASATSAAQTPPAPAAIQRRPWPQGMTARGMVLEEVTSWPKSASSRPVRGVSAQDLADRLRQAGAHRVAPELIEAVAGLLNPQPVTGDSTRLVFGPDGCGQEEATAFAATLLDQRFHATTLVVTAGGADELTAQLQRWLPSDNQAAKISRSGEPPIDALIWVVAADVLSDRLLPMLREPRLVKRIGLVVWWHLQDYTGVLGANLWAISRRLHRMIGIDGRHDIRTLALVRSAPHGGAQLGTFVRRLLPHPFPTDSEIHVEQNFPHEVRLYRLVSHQTYFTHPENRSVQERSRHLPLIAARSSVQEGWETHLEVPEDVASSESKAVQDLPVGQTVLGEQLKSDRASAAVSIRQLRAPEILSLIEIVSQGARAASDTSEHYAGLTLANNPYVKYLLSTLTGRTGRSSILRTSRRLVCAEAHPSIIRRHLLLALNEVPDTRTGLLRNFLWQEEIIEDTLDQISHEGKLTRREVRFLGEGDRLIIDYEYESQRLPSGEHRPLDTVSPTLIEVREEAVGFETEGIRMRVDPERLTIQAYPNRVFMQAGRRFRIREWDSPEAVRERGWITCEREDIHSYTWRIRNSLVFDFEPLGSPVGIGRKEHLLTRIAVDLQYEEEVSGNVRVIPDLTTGAWSKPETIRPALPITQSFATRALVLRFPEPEDFVALASLCQALRHVLPVHLGVEEDALEVVPLTGDDIDGQTTFGVAIVDLYPGGIGLIDAIRDDTNLILELLEWTRAWLSACPCKNSQGCPDCLLSPAALAANSTQIPQRTSALKLLNQII